MGGLISSIASAAADLLALIVFIYWLSRLVRWDGRERCDETQCDTCPFPCEKHENR